MPQVEILDARFPREMERAGEQMWAAHSMLVLACCDKRLRLNAAQAAGSQTEELARGISEVAAAASVLNRMNALFGASMGTPIRSTSAIGVFADMAAILPTLRAAMEEYAESARINKRSDGEAQEVLKEINEWDAAIKAWSNA